MATGGSPADYRCTPERTNYARLCRVIIDLCSQVLRDVLSRQIPSHQISQKAKQCTSLRLNPSQRGILGTAISRGYDEFDVSLLYALIRNLCPGISPTNGWTHANPPPAPTEITEGDDIERIHFIRNNGYGHMSKACISVTQFKQYWQILQGVMVRMDSRLGGNYSKSLSMIEKDNMDEANHNKYMDLVKELKCSERDLQTQFDTMQRRMNQIPAQEQTIQRWVQEDSTFVSTCATKSVRLYTTFAPFVTVSGVPGSGKSAIIHHIALELQEEGYHIVPVYTSDEIIRYWAPGIKQVFVLDDPFGVHNVDEIEVNNWNRRIESLKDCLKGNKILISIRKYLANERQLAVICKEFDHVNIDICSNDLLLKEDEKSQIFRTHMRSNGKDITNMSTPSCELLLFPLLCRVFAADKDLVLEMDSFFNQPISVLHKDILRLRDTDKLKYFCLVLCLVYDGALSESVLNVENEDRECKVKRKAFLDLCELSTSTSKTEIRKNMDILIGTYIIKEGYTYKFLHDVVFDTVVSTLSTDFHESILKHCSSTFVRKRVLYSEMVKSEGKEDNTQPFILLDNTLHKAWGDRLVKDIKDGKAADVFFNDCLKLQKSDEILLNSLKGNITKMEIEKLMFENISEDSFTECKRKREDITQKGHEILGYLSLNITCVPFHFIFAYQLEKTFSFLWNTLLTSSMKNRIISSASLTCTAAGSGNENILRILIDEGANIDATDEMHATPLLLASVYGHDKIVQILVEKDADVNLCDKYQYTPLFHASLYGHHKVVQILVDNGADVNLCDKDQHTPLFHASLYGHHKVVQILVDNGADVNLCDKDQHTPLFQALVRKFDKVVQILVDNGADVNLCDKDQRTPLFHALERKLDKVVQILVDNGADVNLCDKNQRTPLFDASVLGHDKIVQMLVDKGADVNHCDKYQITPLFHASVLGHDKVVQILVDSGADVNLCDTDHHTPLFHALFYGHAKVVQILKRT